MRVLLYFSVKVVRHCHHRPVCHRWCSLLLRLQPAPPSTAAVYHVARPPTNSSLSASSAPFSVSMALSPFLPLLSSALLPHPPRTPSCRPLNPWTPRRQTLQISISEESSTLIPRIDRVGSVHAPTAPLSHPPPIWASPLATAVEEEALA